MPLLESKHLGLRHSATHAVRSGTSGGSSSMVPRLQGAGVPGAWGCPEAAPKLGSGAPGAPGCLSMLLVRRSQALPQAALHALTTKLECVMVGKMAPVNLPNPKPQTSTPEPPKSKLTPRARRASCSCGALLRKPSRSCPREAARAALLSRAAALDLRQPTARGTLRLWKAGSGYRLSASTVLL